MECELTKILAPRLLELLWGSSGISGPEDLARSLPAIGEYSQSTPGDAISPTVLLSPVLSRPVRSQSATSTPFLMNRSMSGGGSHPFDSFSESELTPGAMGHSGVVIRSRANSRTSRPSESSNSPLASTPPCRSPIGGQMPTGKLAGHHSGSFLDISTCAIGRVLVVEVVDLLILYLSVSSSQNIARQTSSQHGSLSQNDSFESTAVDILLRSHSDAQECRQQRPNYAANNSSSRNLLNEHHLNRVKRMRRRPSNSMRAAGSNIDFLNTSLDSNSGQLQPNMSSSSNLQRWRLSPLGHSDPQLYTATTSSAAGNSGSGLLGVSSRKYGPAAGRRSFLSVSPLTSKLRKESFLASSQAGPSGSPSTFKNLSSHSPILATAAGHHPHSSGQHGSIKIRMRSSTTSMHTGAAAHQASLGVGGNSHLARASISGAGGSTLRQSIAIRSGSSLAAPVHFDNRRWSLASLPSSSGYGTPGSNSNSAFSSQYSSQEHLADMMADLRVNSRFDSNESYSCFEDAILGFRPRSRSLNSPHGGSEYGHEAVPAMSSLYKERFPKAKAQMENKLQQFLLNNAPLSGFTTSMILNVMPPPVEQHRATSPACPSREFTPPNAHHHRPSRPSSPRPSSPIPDQCLRWSPTQPQPLGMLFSDLLASTTISLNLNAGGSMATAFAAVSAANSANNSGSGGTAGGNRSNRCSFMVSGDGGVLTATDPSLLRLISEGATRFLHHQICEIVADCLQKSREDLLTCSYFCNMSVRLDETLAEAEVKTGADSYKYLAKLVKQILMIVSRAARLLECLEFDPDEFYHLLEEAEGAVRVQLGSGTARVPDLPQYIVTKLGLNKNLLIDQVDAEADLSPDEEPTRKRTC
uniref:Microtubule-associated serine/threonine-protein kinase pre-PK domain-containing protein n=1 Tax=Ditylenchus dipsaci TaxID=166011 RepID=A0A915CQG2_9BILA